MSAGGPLGVTFCLALYIATPLLAETFDPSRANRETAVQTGQALWMYHSVVSPQMAPYGTALAVFLAYVAVFVGGALTRFAVADA